MRKSTSFERKNLKISLGWITENFVREFLTISNMLSNNIILS